jgi:hypothetical protein
MADELVIEFIDYKQNYYSLDRLYAHLYHLVVNKSDRLPEVSLADALGKAV